MQMGERRGRGRAAEEAPGPGGDCRVDCGAAVRNEVRGGLLPVGRGGWGETGRARISGFLVAEQGRTEEDPLPNASSLTAGWRLPFLISCCVFLPLPSL
ncbi:hypothetical protein MRB53_005957 [Persea americana]|uniref:Uncharacterized protein n=1 Tax=Persea americana TaxID=3435 RepID=A0ACC2MF10_PERAE|nr:hypothetical protein MRB53_005957 [Persea americana]